MTKFEQDVHAFCADYTADTATEAMRLLAVLCDRVVYADVRHYDGWAELTVEYYPDRNIADEVELCTDPQRPRLRYFTHIFK